MTKEKFKKLCDLHNVRFRINEELNTLNVDPPAGSVFADTGLHYVSMWLKGWTRSDAYAHVASDLAGGVEPCTIPNCDYCGEENEGCLN